MAGTGRRGPAPAPAAVKKARGNPGKRPITTEDQERELLETGAGLAEGASSTDSTPAGGGGGAAAEAGGGEGAAPSLAPPVWLNEEGREVWQRLAPRLAVMKILQTLDVDAFGRYCQNFGRWVKLQKRLDEEGETYTSDSPHGSYVRANPAFMIADRLDRACERAEAAFALNPADRQRLFAARAAAGTGAPGDLFGASSQPPAGGAGDADDQAADRPRRLVGFLN
jgi:P27 family predicted phage terminase small subunit